MAEEIYKCPIEGCEKVFRSQAALSGHIGGLHRGQRYRDFMGDDLGDSTVVGVRLNRVTMDALKKVAGNVPVSMYIRTLVVKELFPVTCVTCEHSFMVGNLLICPVKEAQVQEEETCDDYLSRE